MKIEIVSYNKLNITIWLVRTTKRVFSKILNYIKHMLILVSTVTGCVAILVLASLVDILIGIASPAVALKICTITGGIKNY